MNRKINIAVVGLNFGHQFAEIYRRHPAVGEVGLCDVNAQRLQECADKLNIAARYTHLDEVLAGNRYDAVHICTPFKTHAPLCMQVMQAGKHCASAVPMGMTLEELRAVLAMQRKMHVNYMMMETGVYTSSCLYAKALLRAGTLGRIQLLRGTHSQDLEGLPAYWMGFPPMLYITHAIAPLLDLANTCAIKVHCLGSGSMRQELVEPYGNPYPAATAIFRLAGTSAAIEITRTAFEIAPYGGEGFGIYGSQGSFMYFQGGVLVQLEPLLPGKPRGHRVQRDIKPPYRPDVLPVEIGQLAAGEAAWHEGSHPHLAHEFVQSIVEDRNPYVDAVKAANWCAPGICANESMQQEGAGVEIPVFQ